MSKPFIFKKQSTPTHLAEFEELTIDQTAKVSGASHSPFDSINDDPFGTKTVCTGVTFTTRGTKKDRKNDG